MDGRKGVYHINAVGQVTQMEAVASVEAISECHLIPGLSFAILDAIALKQSDDEAADAMREACRRLFQSIHEREEMRA